LPPSKFLPMRLNSERDCTPAKAKETQNETAL